MHIYNIKYKKYLRHALSVFLCITSAFFLSNNTNAFQISGNGNNLRVIQSNQAKSTNFQVNAKLKPTTAVASKTSFYTPPPELPTPETKINTTDTGSDGSSPHLGTANWNKQGRSQRATDKRKNSIHNSAPKETPNEPEKNDIPNEIEKTDNLSNIDNTENKPNITNPSTSPTIEYNPKKDRLIVTNDSKVILNPAKFSLKFLESDMLSDSDIKENYKCSTIIINSYKDFWYIIAKTLFLIVICLTGTLICLAILVYIMWRKSREKKKNNTLKSFFKKLTLLPILFLIFAVTSENASAGPVTTPQQLIYEGDLLDNAGNPLTGNYSFRFSLWDNEDFEAADIIAGNINIGAADYYNWQESQSQNLTDGKFSLKLGTVEPFFTGLFDHSNMYLQVEVKNTADPNTSYELIDINTNDNTIDRTIIDTIPFAFNSDKLDFHDTGFGANEIPFLDGNAKFDKLVIPDGINENNFTLDSDGDAAANDILTLKFGDILNKTLSWNGVNDQFEFNDNVNITGNLIVTGTINGTSLAPKDKIEVLSPRYPNSVINQDGSDNSGSMYEETSTISGKSKNIIKWNTIKPTIQDYDLTIRYTLPANFAGFKPAAVSFEFMTEGLNTDAKVNFVIEKEGSVIDELAGTGMGLNSNAWTTVDLNLNPATIWNPNDIMVIKIKLYSRNNLKSYISDIVLNYEEN